ncbi:ZSWM1 protein, partial [Turnix velox]|nr:ZSWM1 protein [Turnix velox]
MALETVIQELRQIFRAGHTLESCIISLAQHYQECVSKDSSDAMMSSLLHPDLHAAQVASQNLPASDTPLASQSSIQASLTTTEAQQQQPVTASLTTTEAQQQPVTAPLTPAKSPEILLQGPLVAPQVPEELKPETPQVLFQHEAVNPRASLGPSKIRKKAIENPEGDSEEETEQRRTLRDICTEPAVQLCLNEFAVMQKSMHMIGTEENALTVQLMEDSHRVDLKGMNSCSCYFNQTFQLPCRHILAALNAKKKNLQPEMLSKCWQKESGANQAEGVSADSLLEILRSAWDECSDKYISISFLMAEIRLQLNCCSEELFELRFRTLRELADSWIGPYIQVKL